MTDKRGDALVTIVYQAANALAEAALNAGDGVEFLLTNGWSVTEIEEAVCRELVKGDCLMVKCRDCGDIMSEDEVKEYLSLGMEIQLDEAKKEGLCCTCLTNRQCENDEDAEDIMTEFCR